MLQSTLPRQQIDAMCKPLDSWTICPQENQKGAHLYSQRALIFIFIFCLPIAPVSLNQLSRVRAWFAEHYTPLANVSASILLKMNTKNHHKLPITNDYESYDSYLFINRLCFTKGGKVTRHQFFIIAFINKSYSYDCNFSQI